MRKILIFSAVIITALIISLVVAQSDKTSPTVIGNLEKLANYHKPEQLAQHPRPEITVDEHAHRRWVTSLEESSLRGSRVDLPSIQFNQQAITQLSPDIKFYFSYFSSLEGEMAPERIQQLVYDNMHANYPDTVANELFDLFLRYQLYYQALGNYLGKLTPEIIKKHALAEKQISHELQRHFFTQAESHALFTSFDQSLEFTPTGRLISEKLQEYESTPNEGKYQKAIELFGKEAAERLHKLEH